MTDHLVVLISGEPIGDAWRSPAGDCSFTYNERYRSVGRVPLSPALPIGDTRFKHGQIAAYLEGLLPENPGVRTAWADELETTEDAFDLLTMMGKDCMGAVQFATEDGVDEMWQRGGDYVPVTDEHLGNRLRDLRDDAASWTLPEEHWSLPGAQEKFTLALLSSGWNETRGAAASTHIVKPGVTRLTHQATLEYATMQVGGRLGLRVAETDLRDFDGETAIVVERFDRYRQPGDAVGRLHQVDLCQAMGRFPRNKYEEKGGPRAAALATMIGRESANAEVDVRSFSDAVLFNYVVGAPDSHSKNLALLYAPDGRARLAPLYDMSSAFAYEPRRGGYDLGKAAMSIGGRRKFGEVLKKHFERHAQEMGLDPDERLTRAAGIAAEASPAFKDVFDSIGTEGADELAQRMLPRLARHCDAIIARIGAPESSAPRARTGKYAGTA